MGTKNSIIFVPDVRILYVLRKTKWSKLEFLVKQLEKCKKNYT